MSRRCRKTPKIKYCGYGKQGKRWANKVVRRERDFAGKSNTYRKLYDTWNINDVVSYCDKPKESNKREMELWKRNYYRK